MVTISPLVDEGLGNASYVVDLGDRRALAVELVGELAGGMTAWRVAGRPEVATPLVGDPATLVQPVLDIRQAAEHAAGHIPEAALVELGSLQARVGDLGGHPVTVMCGHGERAATAASLLERAGGTASVFLGSARNWSRAVGRPLTARA